MKGPTKDGHLGRPAARPGLVNPDTAQGSTVLFGNYASFVAKDRTWHYGRMGGPTHRAFEESLMELEGAACAVLCGSGLQACALAFLAYVSEGGHVLVTDSAYEPTRAFCDIHLKGMGVRTTYFDPHATAEDIAALIEPDTQLIFCESPGSITFEVQDIPAIVKGAGDVPVAIDNTYGAGVHLRPLDLGVTLSVQAVTKYIGGHSDLLLGAVLGSCDAERRLRLAARILGISVSAHDVALAHRGLRSLHRRLAVHEESGLALARFLEDQPEVARVIHPGLESHPHHALWARDARGTNGLFSVIMDWEGNDEARTATFVDNLDLYGLGYSWGGYESLCMPAWPQKNRTTVPWTETRQLLRFHVGLEDIDDLIDSARDGFRAVRGMA